MSMNYRRWTCVAAALASFTMIVIGYVRGNMVSAFIFLAITGVMLGLMLFVTRPRLLDAHVNHAAATAAAGDDDVILYWRPG